MLLTRGDPGPGPAVASCRRREPRSAYGCVKRRRNDLVVPQTSWTRGHRPVTPGAVDEAQERRPDDDGLATPVVNPQARFGFAERRGMAAADALRSPIVGRYGVRPLGIDLVRRPGAVSSDVRRACFARRRKPRSARHRRTSFSPDARAFPGRRPGEE